MKIHGEAHISCEILEIRPFGRANSINDWMKHVTQIVSKYNDDFQKKSIPSDANNKFAILQHLQKFQQEHKDFHFSLEHEEFIISGCSASVTKALELTEHILEKEIEISHELQLKACYIEYLTKFAKEDIELVQPPVTVTRSSDKSGVLCIKGVKHSLDKVEKIVREKTSKLCIEYYPISQTAHHLLNSRKGKLTVEKVFGGPVNSVCYMYEKTQPKGELTHQVCIMSPDAASLALARSQLELLCKEKKIPLPQQKLGAPSTNEWQTLVDELGKEFFVSVRASGGIITIIGEHTDVEKAAQRISTFLENQGTSTEELKILKPTWEIINSHDHCSKKLAEVRKEAERRNVTLALPEIEGTLSNFVMLTIKGELQFVENIKCQLQLLMNEVITNTFQVSSRPGIQEIVEKGILRKKCNDISQEFKVVVDYTIEEDTTQTAIQGPSSSRIQCLLNAKSSLGIDVVMCIGSYAQQECDAMIIFIPNSLDFTEPVFKPLFAFGGPKIQSDLEVSLGSHKKMLPNSTHYTYETGNLKCEVMLHVVLQNYSDLDQRKARNALIHSLGEAFGNSISRCKKFVLCPLSIPPLNYPTKVYADALVHVLSNSNFGMCSSDFIVQVFVNDPSEVSIFEQIMRESSFNIVHCVPTSRRPLFHGPTPQEGWNGQSLKDVMLLTKGDMFALQVSASHYTVIKIKMCIPLFQTDVYINSTGTDMNFSTGSLSGLFKSKCGKALTEEAGAYLQQHGKLEHEKVAVTKAHSLNAKAIYHVSLKKKDQPDFEQVR